MKTRANFLNIASDHRLPSKFTNLIKYIYIHVDRKK